MCHAIVSTYEARNWLIHGFNWFWAFTDLILGYLDISFCCAISSYLFLHRPKNMCLPYCFLLILIRKQDCLLQYWQIIIDVIIHNGERTTCLLDKIIKGDTTKSLFFFPIIHIVLKTQKYYFLCVFGLHPKTQNFNRLMSFQAH